MYFISETQPDSTREGSPVTTQSIILIDKRLPSDRRKAKYQLPLLLISLWWLQPGQLACKDKTSRSESAVKILKWCLVADDIIIHMKNHRMQRWNEAFHVEEYHEEWQNKGKEVQDIAEWNQRAKMKETSMVCEAWYEEGLPSPNRLVYTLHTISTEPHLECMHTEKLIWNPHGTTGVLQQPQQPWGKGSTCTSKAS